MKARVWKTAAVVLPLLAVTALLSSWSHRAESGPVRGGKFIGAAKCKNCHSSEANGNQYGVWSAAKHAHAFEVLGTDEAKASGAQYGVEDPATSDTCLACHVTGHGQPEDAFARGFKAELGVQCETCHGPGEDHMKARFKAAASGEAPEGHLALPEGEVLTAPGVEVCTQCHNPKSPNYKPFCYFEARGKIAHLDPRKERSAEEKASHGTCPCGSPCPHAEGCPDGKCNLKPADLAALKE